MKSFAAVALAVILAPAALAQHQTFAVSPDASAVKIRLDATHEVVNGTFHVQSGSIDFNRNALTISGSVIVSAGSGKTGNDSRDKRMATEVLDAARFAEISFSPNSYTGTIAPSGDSTIQVTGTFTLHGTPHEMTVPMQIHIDGTSCTAKTKFNVPYVQWGLKDPSIFILKVAKEVEVDLSLSGRLTTAS
jgi:polyisoprenoid-binding protein YceI